VAGDPHGAAFALTSMLAYALFIFYIYTRRWVRLHAVADAKIWVKHLVIVQGGTTTQGRLQLCCDTSNILHCGNLCLKYMIEILHWSPISVHCAEGRGGMIIGHQFCSPPRPHYTLLCIKTLGRTRSQPTMIEQQSYGFCLIVLFSPLRVLRTSSSLIEATHLFGSLAHETSTRCALHRKKLPRVEIETY
jgi:hypothetical protein